MLIAEQVASTTDIEIMTCEREAGAEGIETLHHLQPALRRGVQHTAGGQRQISVAPQLRAANSSAQLIELSQPEHIRAMHDDRVRRGDIEPGFDDVGREQQVVTTLVERRH